MGGGQPATTVEKNDPWAGQQPYLKQAFSDAQKIYENNKSNNLQYNGDYVAGATPQQLASINQQLAYVGPNGAGTQGNAAGMNSSIASAQGGLAGSQGAMNGLFGYANSDATGTNVNNANRYINNDLINGQIDAASRDVTRNLGEVQLPGIQRNAAATGNANSSRTGIAQGIAMRGAQDQIGDIASGIRGNAYQSAIQAAQSDAAAKNAALTTAGQLGQGQLSTGLQGINSSIDNAQTLSNIGTVQGSLGQAANQSKIDNDLAKFQAQLSLPYQNLQQYWNVVGDKSWGGTTTTTQKSASNPMGTLGAGLGVLGSFFASDRRIKKNIEHVGYLDNGLALYSYEYKDEPGIKHVSPMAQEVLKKYPEDVVNIDGVLHVHTDALTRV